MFNCRFAAWLAGLSKQLNGPRVRRKATLCSERLEDRTLLAAVHLVDSHLQSLDGVSGDDVADLPAEDSEPGARETIAINFQDDTTPVVPGYLVASFEGFDDRGNGFSYGWVTESSATDADGTTATPINGAAYPAIAINERTGSPFDGYDPRLTGYAHFDLASYPERTAWEIALNAGSYEVTVSVGDTGGPNDSNNQLLVEGNLVTGWQPTDTYKSQLLTTIATVEDGFLTLAAPDGTITEMQYLEIRELPDLTPGDSNPASADYAQLANPVAIGAAGTTPQSIAIGAALRPEDIDPTRSFAFDVSVVDGRGGVLETSLTTDNIQLYETLTGAPATFSVNTTGGFDAVVINPTGDLKENTSYTIAVDGLLDRGSNTDPNALPREFEKYTTTFVTGEAPVVVDRDVAFFDQVLATEGAFSSVVMSPDGTKLYVSTLGGRIIRWDLDAVTGGIIGSSRQELVDAELDGSVIIGLVFDPTDTSRLWVTSNEGGLSAAADFTGRVVTVDIDGTDTSFTATTQEYIVGLPRSVRDHLSNSLTFRQNPDAGLPGEPSHLLYLIQGSNSAMGAPDSAWGYRPERALSAAVIEIDPTLDVSSGPLDVQTEQEWTSTAATALEPLNDPNNPNSYNADGSVTGFYNPFALDAPVKVFAAGQRNAYDLVWHSNGILYVPTNGSAGGANAPDDPSTPQDEGLTGIPTQNDYLFAVEEDGYYGHPNPIRGDFILNGGNPTSGTDPAEVVNYPVGTQPDPEYQGFAFDFGRNVSPNGAAEFTSNVFGNNLQAALIVAQYSGPDNLIALTPGPDGNIVDSQILRRADGSEISYNDPLDLIVNPATGQIYLVTFNRGTGASELVLLTPDPADADISVQSLDDAAADDRLVFSRIDNPANAEQQFRDVRQFEILNDGGAPLTISDISIGGSDPGAFQIISGPANGAVLAAGASASVTIEFVGSDPVDDNDAVSFDAVLTITSDDIDEGTTRIALSGLAQIQSEGGEEPSVAQIVQAFGYSTDVAQGQLANGGLVEMIGDEVLMPHLQRVDSSQPIEIIQIAAYLQQGNVARLNMHGLDGLPVTELFAQDDQEGQTLLPNQLVPGPGAGGTARGTIDSDTPFGLYISVDNRPAFASWSDPEANERDPDFGSLVDDGDGHLIRFFQAKDATGNVIVGTFIGIQDYPGGGNFDYNDHMFVIKNVQPYALTTAEDADGNGINDALETDSDGDSLVDFFDLSGTPPTALTFQAEDSQVATIFTGSQSTATSFIQILDGQPGFNGTGYVDYGDGIAADETLQFDLASLAGGEYDLIIRYAVNGADRPLDLTVNGASQGLVSFPDTDGAGNAGFQTWGTVTQRITLVTGDNVIALSSTTNAGPNIDEITLVPVSTLLTFQAEDSQIASIFTGSQSTGTNFIQIKANQPGFNGTGYVDYGNGIAGDETLQFDLPSLTGGEYDLIIRYALNGADRPLDLTVNAISQGLVSFPDTDGAGNAGFQTWGTVTERITLSTGANVIVLTSTTNAGANIDEITLVPNADIGVQSLDDAAPDDRLVFSRIDTPANAEQQFRDVREFEIVNDGFAPLTISDISIGGSDPAAFQINSGPANGAVLAAGNSAPVVIEFVGSDPVDDNAAVSFDAVLTITSDDLDEPARTIALSGLAQIQSESGEESSVAQIVEAFGFGTDVAQSQLANGGLVETVGDEVLMPWLRRLDSFEPIEIIQIAAYLRQGDVARLGMHSVHGAPVSELFAQDDQEGQTLLPNQLVPGTGAGDTARIALDTDEPFGLHISVDNRPTFASWSDPEINERDPDIGSLVDDGDGHLIRFFQAKDAVSNVIAGTFIGIQDYPGGGNFDYNDHVFVIKNVQPYVLSTAEDADGNGINDALESDSDADDLPDFFDQNDALPTFVVNTNVDSVDVAPGDGVAQDAAGLTSLRAAVMEANALADSNTIQLAPGIYSLTLTGAESEATNDLDVTSNVTIVATGGGLTTIDAGGIDRVLHIGPGGILNVEGVGITGGDTPGSGGGIFNDGGTVNLVNTTVADNTAADGGGISNTGHLHINNSTISGNTGGGIDNVTGGTLHATRSTISNNTADVAAGITNAGTAFIDNTIVAGNTGTVQNTDVGGTFSSAGFNLIGKADPQATGFVGEDFVGTVNNPINPQLDILANNGATTLTHALLPGSVAIDGGKNNVGDSSGNGNSAAVVGDVVGGDGVSGPGADFPGGVNDVADDFLTIDVSNVTSNHIPTTAITVAAWAKITQTGFRHEIFASQTGGGEFITHAELLPDGTARFTLRDNSGNTIVNFIGGSVPFDTWFHYAATYDEATNQVDVYINGVSIFSGPSDLNLSIGSDWDSGARVGSTTDNARPFTGQMDEFYLFTRALSGAEVATLVTVPATPAGLPQVTGDLSIYYSFDGIVRSTDQRGGPRELDGDGLNGPTIDIGAFERVNDFDPNNPIPEVIQTGSITVRVEQVATGLVSPSLVVNSGDGSGRVFVSDQIGFVHLIKNGILQGTPFLDITASITDTLNGNQEVGLSGFTFHPDFAVTGAAGYGKFYTLVDELVDELAPVDFTHFPLAAGQERAAQSVLREWTMNDITDDVFSGTSRQLVRIDQPHDAHSAGNVVFGPDGYLYISLGDGGTHDDQGPGHNPVTGNARDMTVVYGKILRIDPLGSNSANGQYGIPATNPFVSDPTALDEIFFYGLRNPFRFSFEKDQNGNKTNKIVIGDTGQDHIEEVDRADIIDDAGGHFGWNLKEGTFLFDAGPPPGPGGELRIGVTANSPGSPLGLIDPVVQYDHDEGTAVIGGETYQGDLIPALKGMYIFGDFNETFASPNVPDGRIFYADLDAPNPEIRELNLIGEQLSLGGGVSIFIKGFGLDESGELFVVGSTTLSSADNSGVVLRLTTIQADLSVTTHGNEEGPVDIVYTVTLSKTNDTGAPITFDLDDLFTGTATSGDDYTAIPGNAQISVPVNDSTGTLSVPVIDDGLLENTETLIARISNPSNAAVTIVTDSATANISDLPPASGAQIIDNGETGFAIESGTWGSAGGGVNANIRFAATGDGSAVASWTFTGLVAGQYRVSATWAAHNNRATDSPFTIYDGATERGTVDVDQQLVPSGSPELTDLGAAWQDLGGLHNIAGDTLVVRLTNDANQYVIADAVRIQRIGDLPPASGAQIIDNGETGFAIESGTWGSAGGGVNANIRFAATGDGSAVASWTFTGLVAGQYRVSATWAAHNNRATDSPFTIYDGATERGTVDVDQQLVPSGSPELTDLGAAWQDLGGLHNIAGDTLVVRLTNDANQYVIADAIRIQRIEPLLIVPEIQVLEGITDIVDDTGGVSFGSTEEGTPVSKTFTVKNVGTADLTLQPVSAPAGFTVTTNIAANTVLAPGTQTTFTVRLDAAVEGTFSGQLSLANTDSDEDPFDFAISGTVTAVGLSPAQIIDNGETGFAIESGTWGSAGGGVNSNIRFAATGDGSAVASWTFTGLVAGQYRVSATWAAHNNRATDSPFTIYDGATERGTVDVDQQLIPSGSPELTDLGAAWQDLGGLHNIAGDTLVVRLTNDANQYVIADAVRIQRIGDLPPASGAQIIDNGETGFAIESGTWGSAGGGVNANIRFAATGDGSAVASWTFTGLVAGQYRVSATWAAHNNRATDSPFTIYDGGTERGTVDVDQQLVPSGSPELTDLGAAWQDLGGLHNIAGDTLVVRLTNDANQYVIADAIRIQRIEPLLIVPEIQVLEGITDIVDDTGGVSFGSTEEGTPVSKTFTVKNVGTADLTLQPVSAPAGFTVTTNIAANTVLAPGTQTTFTVRLDAAVEGTFSGQLSLANTDSDEDPFDLAISGTVTAVGLSPAQIIDNGETGFAIESGTWGSAGGGVNSNIRFAATGDGSAVASWTFTGLVAGQYRVSATWAAHNNRATDSPFTIYDGATERGTVDVDQQLVPSGSPELTDLGAAWQDLGGLHNIAGDTLVVRLTNDANQYVIADAVRIQRIGDLPPASGAQIIDNGETGFAIESGAWGSAGGGVNANIRFAATGDGSAVASWTFTGLVAGQYRVSATWAAHNNRATDSPFTIYDGATERGTVDVDQQLVPSGSPELTDLGAAWQDLGGLHNIAGDTLVVRLTNDANQYVIADAVRIQRIGDLPPASGAQIIDNGETGFAIESGTWGSAGGGVNANIRFAATGDGSAVASWTFTGLVAGQYRVSATWAAHNNRATDSPFTIYDGATERGTVDVNQQLIPSGSPELTDLGAAWQDLGGLHNITGDTLVVRLTNDANQFVIADAIRIERIS